MGAVGFLFLGGCRLHLALGFALAHELIVGAGVIGQLAVFQMQDCADRTVQQFAVVGNDQHGVGVFYQIGLEPQRAFQIQIVGRLVQQQVIGFGKQHSGQSHPHPPATGKGRAGHVLFLGVKPQTLEDRGGAGFGGIGVDIGQTGMDVGDAMRIICGFGFGHQFGAFHIGGQNGVQQGHLVAGHFLTDAANARAGGQGDGAGFRRNIPTDQVEQRGFTRAIAPDQAHFVARWNDSAGPFKKGTALDCVVQIIDA